MLSATGITAAIAILALTVNVIDTTPAPPGASSAHHVVAADGSSDFSTIQAAVDQAVELLREGEVVALATETVYGLGANAFDANAVQRVRDQRRLHLTVGGSTLPARPVRPPGRAARCARWR